MRIYHPIILISFIAVVLFGAIQFMVYKANAASSTLISAPMANTVVSNPSSTPVSRQSGWLSVTTDKTTLMVGDTLGLTFTLTNKYDDATYITNTGTLSAPISGPLYTSPADTNYTFDQDQCWAFQNVSGSTQFPKSTGKFHVTAGYAGWDQNYSNSTAPLCSIASTVDQPWRWSIGNAPLAAGAPRTINGSVKFTTAGTYTLFFGLTKDNTGYPDVPVCSANSDPKINVCGIDSTVITVLDLPTATPTMSKTPTITLTPTKTLTPSNTATTSNTPTKTNSPTMTSTMTNTPTRTNTLTPSNTPTRTNTLTPTNTFTPTNTLTPSNTRTFTKSLTPSRTFTSTPTSTRTEVLGNKRIARFSFEDPLGINVRLGNTIDRINALTCPGVPASPSVWCPAVVGIGVSGNSLLFAGAQYSSSAKPLTMIGDVTVSFWAKPVVGSVMNTISIGNTNSYVNTGFDASGKFFCSNGNGVLTAPSAINDGNWNHYACTMNGVTKNRAIYVNSDRVAMDKVTLFARGPLIAYVGSNTLKSGAFYNGQIDEISIYNSELTYDDIEFLYMSYISDSLRISPTRTATLSPTITSTPFPTDTALSNNLARFSFEETSSAVSFANKSVAANPAICTAPLICPTAGDSGVRFSNAVTFTGSETLKLKSTITTVSPAKPFSVAAWVNSHASSDSVILSGRFATTPSASKFILGLDANGAPYCQYGLISIAAIDTLSSSTWNNLICSIDTNRKIVLYVNGAPVANGTVTTNPSGALTVWIGADGVLSNGYFDGSIDEVSIFNRFATWGIAEVMYDQYAATGRRSPTRSQTATITQTPTKTLSPSKTLTPSKTMTPLTNGDYPYPAPRATPSVTHTSTPSKTATSSPSKTRTETPRSVYYPYP